MREPNKNSNKLRKKLKKPKEKIIQLLCTVYPLKQKKSIFGDFSMMEVVEEYEISELLEMLAVEGVKESPMLSFITLKQLKKHF